ncbi:hypothetical protein KBC75_05085 [Candidatus Shapirobacteria bacterium]|nr:hypothetical protein [Candidatus Shapirobacteria bacterium]
MKNWLVKYQVYVVLILIIIGLVVIKIKYGYKPGEYQEKTLTDQQVKLAPTITPTVVPTKTAEQKNFPMIELLPYKGVGFVIDRYVEAKVLAVKIKGKDKELIKDDVAKWLTDGGTNPADFQIKWE